MIPETTNPGGLIRSERQTIVGNVGGLMVEAVDPHTSSKKMAACLSICEGDTPSHGPEHKVVFTVTVRVQLGGMESPPVGFVGTPYSEREVPLSLGAIAGLQWATR